MDINKNLQAEIENFINSFDNETIEVAGGIDFSAKQRIKETTYYSLSKYLEETKDEFGNELRFRNIGNAIVDLEWRAKNLDRKNIEYNAVDGDHVFSLMVNKEVQQFMDDEDWGEFIDEFQYKKSQFGEVMVFNNDGDPELVSWNYVRFNPRDINGGLKIVEHSLSPLEIRKKKSWDQEVIKTVIAEHQKEKDIFEDITVYDINGEFPKDYFDDKAESFETVRKQLIWAEVGDKKYQLFEKDASEYDYISYSRRKIEGRDFGVGIWEEVRETQIVVNNASIAEQEAVELSGKTILKTNKKDLPDGKAIANGEMVYLEGEEYIDTLNLTPSGGLAQYQSLIDNWFVNEQRNQSAFNSVTGEEVKAGTPFAALALQSAQASSIFDKRRDQDGFNIRDILIKMVLPKKVKEWNKGHVLSASYSPRELRLIDEDLMKKDLAKAVNKRLLQDKQPITEDWIAETKQKLSRIHEDKNGVRTIEIEPGYFTMEKIMTKGRFNITDEQTDNQRRLNVLTTQLQLLQPNDPERREVIAEMLEIQGSSAASLPLGGVAEQQPQMQQPRSNNATKDIIQSSLPVAQQ